MKLLEYLRHLSTLGFKVSFVVDHGHQMVDMEYSQIGLLPSPILHKYRQVLPFDYSEDRTLELMRFMAIKLFDRAK